MEKSIYLEERKFFWNNIYSKLDKTKTMGDFYRKFLKRAYGFIIPRNKRILELGCGKGELLSSLTPSYGVGIDFSDIAIAYAQRNNAHEKIAYYCGEIEKIREILDPEPFDYIILSDLINDLWDVQEILELVSVYCQSETRIIINVYSRIWQLPLRFGQIIKQARLTLQQSWFSPIDVKNVLTLSGYESMRNWSEFLFPFNIPFIEPLFNRFFAKIWPFKVLDLANFFIARPVFVKQKTAFYEVSVIVPARNEAGNIDRIITTVPDLGKGTELIFVEGNSTDNTWQTLNEEIAKRPGKNIKLFKQQGKGKGDAVRLGYENASGDILMILDADLTVNPDDLYKFYNALGQNKGEFINGVRLVYPMEQQAMRFANLIGNKFFSIAFSWMLGQSVKDTLCGTKVMWKKDYETLAANRSYFGDFDPFGDFDLLFGAAKLNLKIVDMPIRYAERTYGTTNISRWKHGLLLLRMVLFAARKIKFY